MYCLMASHSSINRNGPATGCPCHVTTYHIRSIFAIFMRLYLFSLGSASMLPSASPVFLLSNLREWAEFHRHPSTIQTCALAADCVAIPYHMRFIHFDHHF